MLGNIVVYLFLVIIIVVAAAWIWMTFRASRDEAAKPDDSQTVPDGTKACYSSACFLFPRCSHECHICP